CVRAFLARVHGQLAVRVVSCPKDLVTCVLGEMLAPDLGAGSIGRVGEFQSDGSRRLDAGERGAHYLEAGSAAGAAACVPTDVERLVSNRKIGVVGAGAFPEKAGSEVPVGPRGAVAVLDVGST